MTQISAQKKSTICWDCARARRIPGIMCPWSRDYTPVPGWEAIRNDIRYSATRQEKTIVSYIVVECPLFLSDAAYKKLKKQKERKIMNQGINANDHARMDRFDMKTKIVVEEIKIKDKSIALPALDSFAVGKEIVVFISKDGSRIELQEGKDGFPVSGTGRGGAGRIIYCNSAINSLKKRGIEVPQRAALKQGADGGWIAELKTAAEKGDA